MVVGIARRRALFDLALTLVQRRLKLRAARSKLFAALPFVVPCGMLALYVVVFKGVFNVPIPYYPIYLLCGLVPWIFLTQSLLDGISSVTNEAELIKRASFPYELLPLSTVAAMFVYFVLSLVIFCAVLLGLGRLEFELLPLLVLPIVSLFLLVSALTMVLSFIDVYNRDIRFVMASALSAWFFLEPIVYRPSMATPGMRFVAQFDPVNSLVGEFREILYYRYISNWAGFGWGLLVCAGLFAGSWLLFRVRAAQLPKDV